jgi:hypothetical protein
MVLVAMRRVRPGPLPPSSLVCVSGDGRCNSTQSVEGMSLIKSCATSRTGNVTPNTKVRHAARENLWAAYSKSTTAERKAKTSSDARARPHLPKSLIAGRPRSRQLMSAMLMRARDVRATRGSQMALAPFRAKYVKHPIKKVRSAGTIPKKTKVSSRIIKLSGERTAKAPATNKSIVTRIKANS